MQRQKLITTIQNKLIGHFFFVYIHPYMDDNGRTARFVMNSQLVTAGYPWVVVPLNRRQEYMEALEKASVGEDIEAFARFVKVLCDSSSAFWGLTGVIATAPLD